MGDAEPAGKWDLVDHSLESSGVGPDEAPRATGQHDAQSNA